MILSTWINFRLVGKEPVLWIGIVLMSIRIRTEFPCWYRYRSESGLASKQCGSSCVSYPKFYTCWKIRNFFPFLSEHCHILKSSGKKSTLSTFHLLRIDIRTDPGLPDRAKNNADPARSGSGSTTRPETVGSLLSISVTWSRKRWWNVGVLTGWLCNCVYVRVKLVLLRELCSLKYGAYRNQPSLQYCGSMTFWYGSGSGSADPCLWLMDPNPDFSA